MIELNDDIGEELDGEDDNDDEEMGEDEGDGWASDFDAELEQVMNNGTQETHIAEKEQQQMEQLEGSQEVIIQEKDRDEDDEESDSDDSESEDEEDEGSGI